MPVYLFVIGDPLHRLVSGFFPDQYSPSASPRPVTAPAIFPSLDQLGVTGSETADRRSLGIAQCLDAFVGIATSGRECRPNDSRT